MWFACFSRKVYSANLAACWNWGAEAVTTYCCFMSLVGKLLESTPHPSPWQMRTTICLAETESGLCCRQTLREGCPPLTGSFDAVILPSFNYYVPRASFLHLLAQCNVLIKPGGLFYLRFRTPGDWRFGRGKEVERNGFVLECTETGENGLLNVFYEEQEMMNLLATHIGDLQGRQVLKIHYENTQSGITVANDEIVIWGRR